MFTAAAQTHCYFISLWKVASKVIPTSQIQLINRLDRNSSSGIYVTYGMSQNLSPSLFVYQNFLRLPMQYFYDRGPIPELSRSGICELLI